MYSEAALENARKLGAEAGEAAATWVFDGNTSIDTYRQWRKGIEDGDPEIMDNYPTPLSGEYADDMTPVRLMITLGTADDATDDEQAELCDAYEDAHQSAYWAEVERVIAAQLDQ